MCLALGFGLCDSEEVREILFLYHIGIASCPHRRPKQGLGSILAGAGQTPLSVCWALALPKEPRALYKQLTSCAPQLNPGSHPTLAASSPSEHTHCKHISEGAFNDMSQKDLYAVSQGPSQMVQWLRIHLPMQETQGTQV